ncbi:hypothetical protein QQZ08_001894 [Neonectria magnoliae]|uniref:Aminoglycoside phosphotransferase domain-containing protein n=1 Tax=Neonectria magnoliae TaxID=2732573 RepID=A0ABR1IF39_9HYPO
MPRNASVLAIHLIVAYLSTSVAQCALYVLSNAATTSTGPARIIFRMHGIIHHLPRLRRIATILDKLATAWNAVLRFVGAALRSQACRLTPQRHPYPLTYEQQDARKKEFIKSLDESSICDLASRHNNWKACRIIHSSSGSFNACFFVEFLDDGTRWVVRIPIVPAVHNVWAKVQSEVTTMRYIQNKTTIPVPRIYAFGRDETLARDRSTLLAYLILEYVPGQSLDAKSLAKNNRARRNYFYSQLIDIFAQMRQLELPSAGSLIPDPRGGLDPVVGPLLSIPINEMLIQRPEATAPSTAFTSATDFILYQFNILKNTYRLPISEQSLETAQLEVFALEHLERELHNFVNINTCWDNGPFVLSHFDLRGPNIIVDDDLNILAVIDWEWTGSIPRQLFTPPSWIAGREPEFVTGDEYRAEFNHFYEVLLDKSKTSDNHRQLAEEWDLDLPNRAELPIAELLQHHSQLVPIFYRALYPRLFGVPKDDLVRRFFQRGENRGLALEAHRQFESSERYTQYLRDNGLFVPDRDEEAARELAKNVQKLQQLLKTIQEGPKPR